MRPLPSADGLRIHEGLLDVVEQVDEVTLGAGESLGGGVERGALRRLVVGVATLALLIATSYVLPVWAAWAGNPALARTLEGLQPWRGDEDYVPYWNVIGREWLGEGETIERANEEVLELEKLSHEVLDEAVVEPVAEREVVAEPAPANATYPAYAGHVDDRVDLLRPIENLDALAPFYEALTRTEIGYAGAITRVSHWGDSVLGNDGITSAIRVRMQARFGDAGHGFHALTKYDASYKHRGIDFELRSPWSKCYIIHGCLGDGHYGYGGTTVWSTGGAESRFATVTEGPVGRKVSRFELWYARDPRGGKLRVKVDDETPVIVDTRQEDAEGLVDAWESWTLADGPHEISVRAAGGGKARAYGVVLEREGPGVVWEEMALIGSFVKRLLNHDRQHIAGQVAHRDPDLIVLMFGGNDMAREGSSLRKTMAPLEEEYAEVVRMLKSGDPGTACLIMAPIDHGERVDGRVVSRAVVARMVEAQRRVALAEGCGFFDTYAAMGGEGSAAAWYRANPQLLGPDLAHPTRHGHAVIGKMLYEALMVGYGDFRRARAGTPMPAVAREG